MIAPTTKANTVKFDNSTGRTEAMTIQLTAKTFEMLSANLYSNKPRAIIRELSTNAWDSMVEAGNNDGCFDIQLPTALDPVFYIRDYGLGMSEDDVFGIYSQLFASSKTSSNDVTGMIGLGSKSPFSYTDQMILETFQDGKHTIYGVKMDNNRLPTVSKDYEGETEEPNGVKIQFAVVKNDIDKFVSEAESVFMTFMRGPKPNFLNTNLKYEDLRGRLFEIAPNLYSRKISNRRDGTFLYVIQGNVAYPILDDNVGEDIKTSLSSFSGDHDFFIEVPIGTLDFAPSREALTLSTENKQRMEGFWTDLDARIEKVFRDSLSHVTSDLHFRYEMEKHQNEKHLPFFTPNYADKFARENGWSYQYGANYSVRQFDTRTEKLDAEIKNVCTQHREAGIYKTITKMVIRGAYNVRDKFNIIIVDDKTNHRSRIRKFIDGRYQHCLIIGNPDGDPAALQGLLDELHVYKDNIVYTSTLPDVTKVSKPKRTVVKNRWFAAQGSSLAPKYLKTLKDLKVDANQPFYFSRGSNGHLEDPDGRNVVKLTLKDLAARGILDEKLPLVTLSKRITEEQLLETYPKALNVWTVIDQWFETNLGEKGFQKAEKYARRENESAYCYKLMGNIFNPTIDDGTQKQYHYGEAYRELKEKLYDCELTKLAGSLRAGERLKWKRKGSVAYELLYDKMCQTVPLFRIIAESRPDAKEVDKVRENLYTVLRKKESK